VANRELSPREEDIVQLCMQGLTNDAIAQRLNISLGTVNTYWLRIKLKVGGSGRTDTVVRIIKERAELALRDANVERSELDQIIAEKERSVVDLRAALALFHLAMEQIRSTVWATDSDLIIRVIANGEFPSIHFGVTWEIGKSVYEIFKTDDDSHPGVACHLAALRGEDCNARLSDEFAKASVRVMPLRDESDNVMGCVAIMNTASD
jgi:DNA-binding CsgD family transcriptional regulator